MIQIAGYGIKDSLYESQQSQVYRGWRQSDQHPVILKLLNRDYPTPEELSQFQKEFDLTQKAHEKGVIQAYQIHSYHNSLVMVLEDIGGMSLDRIIAEHPLPLEDFFPLAIRISEIVGGLHQRQLIHKDINPTNLIWNQTSGDIQLIDFGIATPWALGKMLFLTPNALEGTLPYLSPEQTGRMHRAIDYRTDLYSLGVTFYQLLTQQLPFSTSDLSELVHSHLAKSPPRLHPHQSDVPPILSDIIGKLMEKNVEKRYQSAWGVKSDLENCYQQFQTDTPVGLFPIGENDRSPQFQIPAKLYGRDQEIAQLRDALEHVSHQHCEFILISGSSGVGKSSLVQEVQKSIVSQWSIFISGKFDQFSRNLPYASLIQAFQSLTRQLLASPPTEIEHWKQRLLKALGSNGQVIIEVIPEMELILGKQPPVPDLPPLESQNRFNWVFQTFIRSLTTNEHLLVMFLDDLQWADTASLHLIEQLMMEAHGQSLFVIGAYRDTEVESTHPLRLSLANLKKHQTHVRPLPLMPLKLSHVCELLCDTLACEADQVQPLAMLCFEKTQGNPFFLNQFLQNLYQQGGIFFDYQQRHWQWNLDAILVKDPTDNVIDLLVSKIQTLSEPTQRVLQVASCIGNKFDSHLLAHVLEQPEKALEFELWKAFEAGLLLNKNNHYGFIHDAVQQAAASLLTPKVRQWNHFKLGQHLLENTNAQTRESIVIDLVYHLNQGGADTMSYLGKERLAQLNLQAGQKARHSNAYDAAVTYFQKGCELLSEAKWSTHYPLLFSLTFALAECEYLCGEYAKASQRFDFLYRQAQTSGEQVDILITKMVLLMDLGQHQEAVMLFRKAMQVCEEFVPEGEEELPTAFEKERGTVLELIGERPIAGLFTLPEMTDPHSLVKMKVMVTIIPAAYFIDLRLHRWLGFRILRLTLQHGNSSHASFGYSISSFITGVVFQDAKMGYEFAKLAVRNSDKYGEPNYQCKAYMLMGLIANHWQKPLREGIPYAQKAIRFGMETGDFLHTGWAMSTIVRILSTAGEPLNQVAETCEQYLPFLQNKIRELAPFATILLAYSDYLTGSEKKNNPLFEDTFYETLQSNQLTIPLLTYHTYRMSLCYLFQDWEKGLKHIEQAEAVLSFSAGQTEILDFHFLKALLVLSASLVNNPPANQRVPILESIESDVAILKRWQADCPENFQHKWILIEALIARLEGHHEEAAERFDGAIDSALKHGFPHNAAIANECAAVYYLSRGRKKIAGMYFQEACYFFTKWGATTKVHQLQQTYSHLLPPYSATSFQENRPSITENRLLTSGSIIDLTTIFKAAQAISGVVVLKDLLKKLIQVVIENAGAERGFLLFKEEVTQTFLIQAEYEVTSDITVLQAEPLETNGTLSHPIIHFVARTREALVLGNASHQGAFTQDLYIQTYQPKSILCLPIVHQRKLMGILYLENNEATDVFTVERLQILQLLSSQAAISLVNARLYAQLEEKVEERTWELKQRQAQLIHAEKMAGLGTLVSGAAHELNNPNNFVHLGVKALEANLETLNGYLQGLSNQENQKALDSQLISFSQNLMMVQEGSQRVNEIIQGLRRFSQMDEMAYQYVPIVEGLQSAIGLVQANYAPYVEFIQDFRADVELKCWAAELNQAFMNLMLNACQAIRDKQALQEDPPAGQLTIRTALQGESLVIMFQDTGCGMSSEVQTKMFEPFFSTREVGEGTGLGLAIVYGIIKKHQGHIQVESKVGVGTTLSLFLPSSSA